MTQTALKKIPLHPPMFARLDFATQDFGGLARLNFATQNFGGLARLDFAAQDFGGLAYHVPTIV